MGDVEQQTRVTETTQETASLHVKNQLRNKNITSNESVCVINTGLHDQRLCKNRNISKCGDMYLQNVAIYLKLLDPVCGNFIWIGISSVRGDDNSPQENYISISWNKKVKSALESLYPTRSFYIDVWNASSRFPHYDNIHFEYDYYQGLANLFSQLM